MKKFVPIIMLGLTCLFASCSSKEPEPECKLKDFPYEIESVEKMTLIVASEKYRHPDMADWSEEELYASEYCYIVKFRNDDDEWAYITWPITDFPYEKGYEYIIEGLCINYFWQDDIVVRTFQCCKILSKQKKQSENLTQ